MKNGKRGSARFKKGVAFVADGSATGQSIETLAEALAQDAECGCGEVCTDCYSYKTMKDFNSTTGEYTYKAVYIVNGALVVNTIANAKAAMDGFKALRG